VSIYSRDTEMQGEDSAAYLKSQRKFCLVLVGRNYRRAGAAAPPNRASNLDEPLFFEPHSKDSENLQGKCRETGYKLLRYTMMKDVMK
jgi:hypothetical protein